MYSVLAVFDTKWKLAGAKGPDDDDLNEVFAPSHAFFLYPTSGTAAVAMIGTFSARTHHYSSIDLALQDGETARTAAVRRHPLEIIEMITESSQRANLHHPETPSRRTMNVSNAD